MMQQGFAQTARRLLWSYWGVSEEALDKEFYMALQGEVSKKLRELLLRGADRDRLLVGREVQFLVSRYIIRARLTNIDPPLATLIESSTEFATRYQERPKNEQQELSTFLAETIRYPHTTFGEAYESLVGIDAIKESMLHELQFLLDPQKAERWMNTNYGNAPKLLSQTLSNRYPLIVLEGEVGSGKTMLARSIGHPLALKLNSSLILYVMNAQVRGGGHVGELTQNISRAFDEAERSYQQEQIPVMLLIDEADALAQTRGTQLTHHEDDAGVNALIQRIDRLRGKPIAVIFATNLFRSLDSAILRRAAAIYHFERPSFAARKEVFFTLLSPLGIHEEDCEELAGQTVPQPIAGLGEKAHRYTYSDLTQRLIPYAIECAIDEQSYLQQAHLLKACRDIHPTPESPETILEDIYGYREIYFGIMEDDVEGDEYVQEPYRGQVFDTTARQLQP